MASQAAAILRVIERKRKDKLRANLAKIQQTHPDTPQHIYSDRLTQQVWNKHYFLNLILILVRKIGHALSRNDLLQHKGWLHCYKPFHF